MREKRPALISFIVDLNLLNVFLLILSFFPKPKFLERYGIYFNPTPAFLEGIIIVLMVITLLIISYGLLNLKRWSFWLMMAYNCFFLVLSILCLLKISVHSYCTPGFIASILGIVITFPAKRYFSKKVEPA